MTVRALPDDEMPWDSFRARSEAGGCCEYLLGEPCVVRKKEQISTVVGGSSGNPSMFLGGQVVLLPLWTYVWGDCGTEKPSQQGPQPGCLIHSKAHTERPAWDTA